MEKKMNFNYEEMMQDIENICQHCNECLGKDCLIGYAKMMINECSKEEVQFIEGGTDKIPPADMRGGYDEYNVLFGIAHLLGQCRGCKSGHSKDCIINVVRNCLEVIEFGEEQNFEGIPLTYMMKESELHSVQGAIILEEYQNKKNKI